ncbi:MAG: hypothetical protein AAGG81_05095, partial [Chlamydiota bacterium]
AKENSIDLVRKNYEAYQSKGSLSQIANKQLNEVSKIEIKNLFENWLISLNKILQISIPLFPNSEPSNSTNINFEKNVLSACLRASGLTCLRTLDLIGIEGVSELVVYDNFDMDEEFMEVAKKLDETARMIFLKVTQVEELIDEVGSDLSESMILEKVEPEKLKSELVQFEINERIAYSIVRARMYNGDFSPIEEDAFG